MPKVFFKIGKLALRADREVVVGILNVTPDSFSDGGKAFGKRAAIEHAKRMIADGADMIDVGGESSRPGARPVAPKEELRRVIPVIEAIRRISDIPLSIDTTKPEVARTAVSAGADVINDIGGFTDPAMMEIAGELKKPVILMHMKGTPRTMQKNPCYGDVTREVTAFLKKRCRLLERHGVKKIIVDPGIGFGKTLRHNLALLNGLPNIAALGYPVMVGASRKSFIEKITGAPADRRLAGSLAVHLHAARMGATLLRVHDVYETKQALAIHLALTRTR